MYYRQWEMRVMSVQQWVVNHFLMMREKMTKWMRMMILQVYFQNRLKCDVLLTYITYESVHVISCMSP